VFSPKKNQKILFLRHSSKSKQKTAKFDSEEKKIKNTDFWLNFAKNQIWLLVREKSPQNRFLAHFCRLMQEKSNLAPRSRKPPKIAS
tara:strand:- start:60 stop:320 length:261 start_codon:yes stop_codon:yes gene_type:complete